MLRLPFFLRTLPAVHYFVLAAMPPDAVAHALAPLEARRPGYMSPLPVVSARIVLSVGGTNVHVTLHPPRLWRILTELSLLLWIAASIHLYVIQWVPADVLLESYPWWLWASAETLPRCFLILLLWSATLLMLGLQYVRHRVDEALFAG